MTYPRLSWSIRRFARLLPAALALAVCLNYCPHNLQAADPPPKTSPSPRRRLPLAPRLLHQQPRRRTRSSCDFGSGAAAPAATKTTAPDQATAPAAPPAKGKKAAKVKKGGKTPKWQQAAPPGKICLRANTMPAKTPSMPKSAAGR